MHILVWCRFLILISETFFKFITLIAWWLKSLNINTKQLIHINWLYRPHVCVLVLCVFLGQIHSLAINNNSEFLAILFSSQLFYVFRIQECIIIYAACINVIQQKSCYKNFIYLGLCIMIANIVLVSFIN